MIDEGYPDPPPVIDPGPDAAVVKVSITDAATGKRISATVAVNQGDQEPVDNPYAEYGLRYSANRHKGPIRFRLLDYYFYTHGEFKVRVPPGKCRIEVRKGYEYRPEAVSLRLDPNDSVQVGVEMERSIDMAARGWYSGDTHVHMRRTGANDDTLFTVLSSRDSRYSYILSYNTTGYAMGKQYETFPQLATGLGDQSNANRGIYYLSSGQEYRPGYLGHVLIFQVPEYIPANGVAADINSSPSLAFIADQVHQMGGYIGLAHGGYHRQEADALLLEDKMDFLELLQFGGYRSLGLDGWYDFLNVGYRIPINGASDFPYTRELASEITYVRSDTAPSPRRFMELVSEGKSFATSGPMLFLNVDGKRPGALLSYEGRSETTLPISVHMISPQYPVEYVELIANGRVIVRDFFPQPKTHYHMQYSLPVNESTWIAARAYADAGTEAHTNPVYVYLNRELPFHAESARHIITRLEGSMETIPNTKIADRLRRLKGELEKLIREQPAALPRPEIP